MGMFDEITCKMQLPGYGWLLPPGTVFQTKSFDAGMLKYHIDPAGGLWWQERGEGMETPPDALGNRTHYAWVRELHFTGNLHFYTSEDKYDVGWIEFEAEMVKGQVISLKMVKFRKPDPEALKKQEDALKRLFARVQKEEKEARRCEICEAVISSGHLCAICHDNCEEYNKQSDESQPGEVK
jgi:hypothetical protein